MNWIEQRHGGAALAKWRDHNETTVRQAARWDHALTAGTAEIVYRFDYEVRSEDDVRIEGGTMHITGLPPIRLVD